MAKVIWTDEALTSLRKIGEYLSDISPEAAASVTEGVWKKSGVLQDYPEIGWQHEDIIGRNVRSLLYGHYRIVYELVGSEAVRVLTVIHTSMDVNRLEF